MHILILNYRRNLFHFLLFFPPISAYERLIQDLNQKFVQILNPTTWIGNIFTLHKLGAEFDNVLKTGPITERMGTSSRYCCWAIVKQMIIKYTFQYYIIILSNKLKISNNLQLFLGMCHRKISLNICYILQDI